MRTIAIQPSLVDQVVEAIVSEIVEGVLPADTRLIQDDLARAYGVSRQPVQQALLLLRNQGIVRDAPGRGFVVAPLDPVFVRNLYEVRAALEGLAARLAAQINAERARREGPRHIVEGRAAIERGSMADQIAADMGFHAFVGELSDNPLIGEIAVPHRSYLRRVMADVLREHEKMSENVWHEHEAILDAIMAGDAEKAESLSRSHVLRAAGVYVGRLQARQVQKVEESRRRRLDRVPR